MNNKASQQMTTFQDFYYYILFPVFYYNSAYDLSNHPSISNNGTPHMAIKTTTTISSFRSLGYRLRELVRKSLTLTFMFFGQQLARVPYLRKQKISFPLLRMDVTSLTVGQFVSPKCKTTYIKNSSKKDEFVCEITYLAYLVTQLYPSFHKMVICVFFFFKMFKYSFLQMHLIFHSSAT